MGPDGVGVTPSSARPERKDEGRRSHSPKKVEADGAGERTDGNAPHDAAKNPPQTPDDAPERRSASPERRPGRSSAMTRLPGGQNDVGGTRRCCDPNAGRARSGEGQESRGGEPHGDEATA